MPLNAKVLHVAPEPAFYRILRGGPFTYHTSDFYLDDVDFPREDIQRLSFKSETYDLILCNHVLEHVPDDQVALRELFRVLQPGGVLLLTVPGDFERPETKYFGHLNYNGHYRDYGRDFLSRFRQVFPGGDVADMASAHPQRNIGVRKGEWLFIGKK
ncbi:MAG: class I SAM-dependent methyltransferase [Cyclobacteriaceae bacterium]|nr:class I SAM-dependent methyltransferase [Cyclobacteriaceae bacterium]